MKEPCTSEMLARPHPDPAFRPFYSHPSYTLLPGPRTPIRRRGLTAVLAARKAAAEAPSSEADVASTQRRTTLPTGRRKQIQQVPSWMAWDRDALREQEENLHRFQSSRYVVAKPEAAMRAGKRTSGKSFTTDFKRAVNTDDFKKAFADTRNDVDYAYYCNGDVQWFGVHVADPDIKRAGFGTT